MPITVSHIDPLDGFIEVVVHFSVESGPPYNYANITVFLEDRDWLLSDLKAAAIEKAKAFVLQFASSHQS